MGLSDFLSQSNNGKLVFKCESIPACGFVDAVQVRDICKIKMLSFEELNSIEGYEQGSPDVMLTHVNGKQEMIYRKDLCSNFLYFNNSKITIAFLKNDTDYYVYRPCEIKCKVMKIPDDAFATLTGKKIVGGKYIVAELDQSGVIDMNSIGVVSASMFKKSYIIPMQDVIKRNEGRKVPKFNPFVNSNKPEPNNKMSNINIKNVKIDTNELGINPSNINIPTLEERLSSNKPIVNNNANKIETPKKPVEQKTKYKYTVINQVNDINNKQIGFTVKEISSGKIKQLTMVQTAQLCSMKLVDNVMIVTRKSTGIKHLQGNGIVLKNLPIVIG